MPSMLRAMPSKSKERKYLKVCSERQEKMWYSDDITIQTCHNTLYYARSGLYRGWLICSHPKYPIRFWVRMAGWGLAFFIQQQNSTYQRTVFKILNFHLKQICITKTLKMKCMTGLQTIVLSHSHTKRLRYPALFTFDYNVCWVQYRVQA